MIPEEPVDTIGGNHISLRIQHDFHQFNGIQLLQQRIHSGGPHPFVIRPPQGRLISLYPIHQETPMTHSDHYRALERMYLAGPINQIFKPRIMVSKENAEIEIEVKPSYFHSAGAVHGAVYFKMLDDAAFFAANSIVSGRFVLTKSFTTHLYRPVSSGRMKSVGKVVDQTESRIHAESFVYDVNGKKLGKGTGVFVRGRLPLSDALGYGENLTNPDV
jgi:uncharacterized protein (TIGR00369 family)